MRTQAGIGARGGKAPCRAACGRGGEVCFPSAPQFRVGKDAQSPALQERLRMSRGLEAGLGNDSPGRIGFLESPQTHSGLWARV